jgi:hypothetical protein
VGHHRLNDPLAQPLPAAGGVDHQRQARGPIRVAFDIDKANRPALGMSQPGEPSGDPSPPIGGRGSNASRSTSAGQPGPPSQRWVCSSWNHGSANAKMSAASGASWIRLWVTRQVSPPDLSDRDVSLGSSEHQRRGQSSRQCQSSAAHKAEKSPSST